MANEIETPLPDRRTDSGDIDDDGRINAPAHLRGWFGKIRRRRWVILFAFEFMVVLLGVLAAQALQARFEAQAERRGAERSLNTLEENARTLGVSAFLRTRNYLCITHRLRLIEVAVAQRSTPQMDLAPPDEVPIAHLGWDGTTPGVIVEQFGRERAERYANIALWTESLRHAQIDEQQSWAAIGRLSTRLGEPETADYLAAKAGLVAATQDLRRVMYAANNIRTKLQELGIETDEAPFRGYRKATDSCRAAVSYSEGEHMDAAKEGRLVTGEPFPEPLDPSLSQF